MGLLSWGQLSPETKLLEEEMPSGQGLTRSAELPREQDDPIHDRMDGFDADYRYADPTTTLYDSLLLNTEDFAPDEVPRYSPQEIADRLYGLPTLIPMDYNRYVQRYVEVYTVRKRDLVARMLGLSRVYFPIFEETLDRAGLPIELKYLPIVESALNPHARSRVGATGLWQFMLGTARMYGLRVNSFVDERRDPYKSSEAAARYLKGAYEEFGDWLLAIASYNCGPGNVRKAILRSGGKRNFWEIMPYLPRETRGYVPAFIAATYAFNYASLHNIYPVRVDFTLHQDTLHLREMDITLSEIAQLTRTDVEELRYLNPELQRDWVPYSAQKYVLRVPSQVANYFAQYGRSLRTKYGKRRNAPKPDVSAVAAQSSSVSKASYSPPAGTKRYTYTVRTGDVVGSIADRYGVRARDVARWNGLYRYRIKPGQKLKIYTTPAKAARAANYRPEPRPEPKPERQAPTGSGTFHTVRSGDTLWDIAKRYNISVQRVKTLNPSLDPSDLKVGQTVKVK